VSWTTCRVISPLAPTGRVLGIGTLSSMNNLSIYLYIPHPKLFLSPLFSTLPRENSVFYYTCPGFYFLFRVSIEYRYLLPPLNRCIFPILVLSSAFLSFSPKLFSCFLCVLVITLLGRGLPCFGFFTVSLWYLASGFYLQMAMYVIGGYSVELPPSSTNPYFTTSPSFVLLFCPCCASSEVTIPPVIPITFHSSYSVFPAPSLFPSIGSP